MQNYISQTYPNATVGDVLGKKEIIKQEFPYLLGTLPYKKIVTGSKYSNIPDNKRHKITFNVKKDVYDEIIGTPITITKSLPELAGKKITLSYLPATPQDEAVINSYLPKPHADGTPIQPNELPSSLPAYLINLKPELRIDGIVVATGTSVGMGNTETFTMTFSGPGQNANDVIANDIEAGEYWGIALDLGRISQEQMQALKTKLEATKAKLEASDYANLTKDDILGDLLYTTALSYHAELGVMSQVSAKTMGVMAITLPSETIFSSELKVNTFFGIPLSASPGGLAMDADRLMKIVKALDGDKNKPIQFMLSLGANSSALEHSVPEQMYSTTENPAQGISAVKALQLANEQGIPIYTINQSNIDTILPNLQLDSGTITDIQSALYYLTSTQNPDGGWAFRQAQGDEIYDSNVYMTAIVLNTLSQFKSIYNLQTPINNGAAYLLTKQNPDGGFGSSPSTTYETALAFEALIASGAVGADKAANIQNAINYLIATQLPNGS